MVVVVVVVVVPDVVPDDVEVLELDDEVVVLDEDDVLLDEVSVAGASTGVVLPASDSPEVTVLSAVEIVFTVVEVLVAVEAAAMVPEPSVMVGVAPLKFDGDDVTVPFVGEAATTIAPPAGTVLVTPGESATLPPVLFKLILEPETLAFCVMVP